MKIGTNFGFFIKRNSLEDVLRKTAEAGFEAVDFSLSRDYGVKEKDEKKFYANIKKLCVKLNLELSQGHSYFIREDVSPEYFLSDEYFNLQVRAIKRAHYLGIPWVVFHPYTNSVSEGQPNIYDENERALDMDLNIRFFKRLEAVFKKYNVGCAIENLVEYDYAKKTHCRCCCSTSDELLSLLNKLNSPVFGVCFDIGHLNLIADETISHFTYALGDKIKVLHVHDNFGILNSWGGGLDRHLPPFFGGIPWKEVVDSLKKIGFQNAFSFECINYSPDDEFDMLNAKYVKKAGEKILNL